MTKYRPPGFVNPIPVIEPIPKTYSYGSAYHRHDLIELGADAMLSKLRESGERVLRLECSTGSPSKEIYGYNVFIPDDKEV